MDPVLYVNSTETIPLDCVSLQTVLSKSLGPLSEWYDRLRVSTVQCSKNLQVECSLCNMALKPSDINKDV